MSSIAARFRGNVSSLATARARKRPPAEDTRDAQPTAVSLKLGELAAAPNTRVPAVTDQAVKQLCIAACRAWRASQRDNHRQDTGPAWIEAQKKLLDATERERPDVAQARGACAAEHARLDPAHLVVLDQSGVSTCMSPARRCSLKGARCLGRARDGHYRTTSFVCALRTRTLVAPCRFDGPVKRAAFRAWVQQALGPVLQCGDIVGIDNCGARNAAGIATARKALGAQRRYLAPYRPGGNPIEQVFAKLTSLFRNAAARTIESLWSAGAPGSRNAMPLHANDPCALPVMASQDQITLERIGSIGRFRLCCIQSVLMSLHAPATHDVIGSDPLASL